jgi:hypothetical protein
LGHDPIGFIRVFPTSLLNFPADRIIQRQTVAGKRGRGTDFRIIRPDGTIRWMRDTSAIYPDEDGSPNRMLGVIQDITERKETEILKDDIEHMMRHDIMNPLNALIGSEAWCHAKRVGCFRKNRGC